MTFPRYPTYKESGIEWLGAVPAHWAVKRLRYVADLNPSKSEIRSLHPETSVSFIPMEAVGDDGSLRLEQTRDLGSVIDGYTYVCEEDVAVAKITPCFENGKAAIMRGLENGVGLATTELTVVRPRPTAASSNYLFRVVTSEPFRVSVNRTCMAPGGRSEFRTIFYVISRSPGRRSRSNTKSPLPRSRNRQDRCADRGAAAADRAAQGEAAGGDLPRRHQGPRPQRAHEGLRRRVAGRGAGALGGALDVSDYFR